MRGYKCDLKQDELQALREEFWKYYNKKEPNNTEYWKIIRQATIMEAGKNKITILDKGLLHLKKNGIQPFDSCINHLVDCNGRHIYIPNFCINEPYLEKELHAKEENREFHKINVYYISFYF